MLKPIRANDYSSLSTTTTSSGGSSLTLEDIKKAVDNLTKDDHSADAYRYGIIGDKIKEAMERDLEEGTFKEPYHTTRNPLARLFNPISQVIGDNIIYI